jgi:hypothetical protein
MTNPPLGISLLVGSQALSYIRQWRSAFGIALKLTTLINVHGAFPKIDRWSSGSQIRERTLQDRRSHFPYITPKSVLARLVYCKQSLLRRLITEAF